MFNRAPLLSGIACAAVLADCGGHVGRTELRPTAQARETAAANPRPSSEESAPDLFARTVGPMLARNCTPCHVVGGKMYDRLPFDKPEVIRENKAGILRRLKDQDREALEHWLASLGPTG